MTIISGALIITNAEGIEEHFGPGEVVFVPRLKTDMAHHGTTQ